MYFYWSVRTFITMHVARRTFSGSCVHACMQRSCGRTAGREKTRFEAAMQLLYSRAVLAFDRRFRSSHFRLPTRVSRCGASAVASCPFAIKAQRILLR